VDSDVTTALEFVQGPLFRFAFALMLFGLARLAIMGGAEAACASGRSRSRRWARSRTIPTVAWAAGTA
jgi:hypothetical protein